MNHISIKEDLKNKKKFETIKDIFLSLLSVIMLSDYDYMSHLFVIVNYLHLLFDIR